MSHINKWKKYKWTKKNLLNSEIKHMQIKNIYLLPSLSDGKDGKEYLRKHPITR